MPKPPSYDTNIQAIIETFYLASRGRNYIDGQPLALSVKEITDVVLAHPVSISRSLLDIVIFAIDDIALDDKSAPKKGETPDG